MGLYYSFIVCWFFDFKWVWIFLSFIFFSRKVGLLVVRIKCGNECKVFVYDKFLINVRFFYCVFRGKGSGRIVKI